MLPPHSHHALLLAPLLAWGCAGGDGEAVPLDGSVEDGNAHETSDDTHGHDGHGHGQAQGQGQEGAAGSDAAVVPDDTADVGSGAGYQWQLPAGFPVPRVPEDNPMNPAKVELGRRLFYDVRLSGNQTQSCASCHEQSLAFTDGRALGLGSTGEEHVRGAMSLVNVAYAPTLTWANPVVTELERQALLPLFGETPVELGMVGLEDELVARLEAEPRYPPLFAEAFPERDGEISDATVTKALAAFQRSIISAGSAYDRYLRGDDQALGEAERRGMELFFSEDLECFHCHGGFNLTDSVDHVGKAFVEIAFHNTGLYNIDGRYPEGNAGLGTFTGEDRDDGRFKAPTLRNVELTAPYMHDGSIATLEEVVEHYAAGGRTVRDGPNAGVGSDNPNRSQFVTGFHIDGEQKRDLVAFLKSLTDWELLEDPRFSDPWAE